MGMDRSDLSLGADDRLAEAIPAIEAGLYGKAIAILAELLQRPLATATRVHALLLLGIVHEARSESQESFRCLREGLGSLELNDDAQKTIPEDLVAKSHVILGYQLAERELLDEAESVIRKALGMSSRLDIVSRAIALGNLGYVLRQKGRHDEAIDVCTEVVRITPDAGYDIYLAKEELAYCLIDVGRLEDARRTMIEAIRSKPSLPLSEMARLLCITALVADRQDDSAAASAYAGEAEYYLRFDTNEESRRENTVQLARIAWDSGDFHLMLRMGRLLAAESDAESRNEGVVYLIRALYRLELHEECLAECEKALADERTDGELEARLREQAIHAASHLGRWEEARKHYRLGQRVGLKLDEYPKLEAYLRGSFGERVRRWLLP